MNPYASERLSQERTREFRAQAARSRLARETAQQGTARRTGRIIRHRTGWALIQIGLALVTSSARGQHRTVSPELP
jgi:hypothetical protein